MAEARKPHELEDVSKWAVCTNEVANHKVDPRFTFLDEVKESVLYQENGVTPVI